jgi:sugar/nucleoside kinase (ribokinase family)
MGGTARTVHVVGNVQMDVVASPVLGLPLPGGDDIVDTIAVRPAGAAGNVSLALAALGVRHRLFGAVGDDQAGLWVADDLRRRGLADDLHTVPGHDTAPDRERAFLTAHGVLSSYGEQDLPADAVEADLVLLTGYFSMPGLRGAGTRTLLERARAQGATTVFDTGWDPEDWSGDAAAEILSMLPLVDIFLPNEPEAVALTGTSDMDKAQTVLREHCAGWVVVKRGPSGVVATGPDGERLTIPAPPVVAVDTTGAGDSLAAGMLADLSEERDMYEALVTGVRVASTVVGRSSRNRYPGLDELLPLETPPPGPR